MSKDISSISEDRFELLWWKLHWVTFHVHSFMALRLAGGRHHRESLHAIEIILLLVVHKGHPTRWYHLRGLGGERRWCYNHWLRRLGEKCGLLLLSADKGLLRATTTLCLYIWLLRSTAAALSYNFATLRMSWAKWLHQGVMVARIFDHGGQVRFEWDFRNDLVRGIISHKWAEPWIGGIVRSTNAVTITTLWSLLSEASLAHSLWCICFWWNFPCLSNWFVRSAFRGLECLLIARYFTSLLLMLDENLLSKFEWNEIGNFLADTVGSQSKENSFCLKFFQIIDVI